MILSHKHKYIFLKTNKTAGTSIEIWLSKYCGHEDIITPLEAEDQEIRNKLGYPGPQNYRKILVPYSKYIIKDWARFLLKGKRRRCSFYDHMPAKKVKKRLSDDIWHSYFKFCFERNPWDRVISFYYYRKKYDDDLDLDDFIHSDKILGLKKAGYDLYTIGGQVVVDKIFLYENLENAVKNIQKHLNIANIISLPKAKTNDRKDTRSYRQILDDKQRLHIAEIFKDEISMFDYEF